MAERKRVVRLVFFFPVLLLAVLVVWWGTNYGSQRLAGYVKERVRSGTNGRYRLDIGRLKVDWMQWSVQLDKIFLERDTAILATSGAPFLDRYDISVAIDELNIGYFPLLRFIRRGELALDHITVKQPQLEIHALESGQWLQKPESRHQSFALRLRIGKFAMTDASLLVFEAEKTQPRLLVSGLHLLLQEFNTKSAGIPFLLPTAKLTIDTLELGLEEQWAEVGFTNLQTDNQQFNIGGFFFRHLYPPAQLNRLKGFRAGKVDLEAKAVAVTKLDVERLILERELYIEKLVVGDAQMSLQKNHDIQTLNPQVKRMPWAFLKDLPLPLAIDTVTIQNGRFDLKIDQAEMGKSAHLFFDAIQGELRNITNIPARIDTNAEMIANASAQFMGKGHFRLAHRFQLGATGQPFSAYGELGSMKFAELNPFIAGLTLLEFSKGRIQRLRFDMIGDAQTATGSLDFEYSGLKISKLNAYEAYSGDRQSRGLVAFAANLVLPKNHHMEQQRYRSGKIDVRRSPHRDIFYFTLQGVMAGVRDNLNLPSFGD